MISFSCIQQRWACCLCAVLALIWFRFLWTTAQTVDFAIMLHLNSDVRPVKPQQMSRCASFCWASTNSITRNIIYHLAVSLQSNGRQRLSPVSVASTYSKSCCDFFMSLKVDTDFMFHTSTEKGRFLTGESYQHISHPVWDSVLCAVIITRTNQLHGQIRYL